MAYSISVAEAASKKNETKFPTFKILKAKSGANESSSFMSCPFISKRLLPGHNDIKKANKKKTQEQNGFAFEIEKELGKKISSFIHQVLVILTKSKFSCPSISKMFIKDRETCRGSKRTSYKFS